MLTQVNEFTLYIRSLSLRPTLDLPQRHLRNDWRDLYSAGMAALAGPNLHVAARRRQRGEGERVRWRHVTACRRQERSVAAAVGLINGNAMGMGLTQLHK